MFPRKRLIFSQAKRGHVPSFLLRPPQVVHMKKLIIVTKKILKKMKRRILLCATHYELYSTASGPKFHAVL